MKGNIFKMKRIGLVMMKVILNYKRKTFKRLISNFAKIIMNYLDQKKTTSSQKKSPI